MTLHMELGQACRPLESMHLFIYCRKCGFVSYDQSKEGMNRDVPPCDDHIVISGQIIGEGPILRPLSGDVSPLHP